MVEFTATQSFHVPARTGKGFEIKRGGLFRIIDVDGVQPVDFWAFTNKTYSNICPASIRNRPSKNCTRAREMPHTPTAGAPS